LRISALQRASGHEFSKLSPNADRVDYPELEHEDFRAVYEYAARVGKRVVKLLIDENLSRRLVARLSDLFSDSIHVTDVALEEKELGGLKVQATDKRRLTLIGVHPCSSVAELLFSPADHMPRTFVSSFT
jgi:hypothetical protein